MLQDRDIALKTDSELVKTTIGAVLGEVVIITIYERRDEVNKIN